jgi:hypothetical protein
MKRIENRISENTSVDRDFLAGFVLAIYAKEDKCANGWDPTCKNKHLFLKGLEAGFASRPS